MEEIKVESVILVLFAFASLVVIIVTFMKTETPAITDLDARTTDLEEKNVFIEADLSKIVETTNNHLAFSRAMNESTDIIRGSQSLVVPDDVDISTVEIRFQQGAPRGVSRENHF